MLKSFYHTGFVVKDLETSARFYSEVLGMQMGDRIERQGEFVEQVLAFPGAHIDRAFLDKGEGHKLELVQYFSPASGPGGVERNDLGAAHLAFFVDAQDYGMIGRIEIQAHDIAHLVHEEGIGR